MSHSGHDCPPAFTNRTALLGVKLYAMHVYRIVRCKNLCNAHIQAGKHQKVVFITNLAA
jgi:hypothetical protein